MEVNGMLVTILMLMLLFGVVKAGLKLAWGTTKFVFGLGLFWLCPLLFVLIVLLGGFTHMETSDRTNTGGCTGEDIGQVE